MVINQIVCRFQLQTPSANMSQSSKMATSVSSVVALSFLESSKTVPGRSFGWSENTFTRFGSKSSCWKMLTLLHFGLFLENLRIVNKSPAHSVEVFFMRPTSPKMPSTTRTNKINNSNTKIENPLELHLDTIYY